MNKNFKTKIITMKMTEDEFKLIEDARAEIGINKTDFIFRLMTIALKDYIIENKAKYNKNFNRMIREVLAYEE